MCAEGTAELYEGAGEYILLRPSQGNGDQLLHMTHSNLDYLERVAAKVEGEVTWAPGAASRTPEQQN